MEGRFESTGIPESRETKEVRDAVSELTDSLSDTDMELFSSIIDLTASEEDRAARIKEFNEKMNAQPAGEARATNRIAPVPTNFGGRVLIVARDEYGRFSLNA